MVSNVRVPDMMQEAMDAMNEVLGRYDRSAKLNSYRDEGSFIRPSIVIATVERDRHGNVIQNGPDRVAYKAQAGTRGRFRLLQPEWLDEWFTYLGNEYRIIGLKPAAPKYPVVTRVLDEDGCDGDEVVLPLAVVQSCMKVQHG